MLEEEAQVIAGLLVGLNVIDCNLGIKDEDLDKPVKLSAIFTSILGAGVGWKCWLINMALLHSEYPSELSYMVCTVHDSSINIIMVLLLLLFFIDHK